MVVLIDTNVILNFLTGRSDPFLKASEEIMILAAKNKFHGFFAIHTLPTIWYVLRKTRSEEDTRESVKKICIYLKMAVISQKEAVKAIQNRNFHDFEDCLQDECAFSIGADYLITCNEKHFINAKTHIVNPADFLKLVDY
ncbi:MAG: PIN domain-containing protein [Selenomonadaceae bacterium]|nr:PIN domain-containing protein [Selenomonadaceae bacterium]